MAAPNSTYDAGVYGTAVYDGVAVGVPRVELFLNGVWVDITAFVRVAEGIQIRRGRQDWSQSPTFATCDLTVDNRDGRFAPRNAAGAFYPYLVRNTPLRVSVYDDSGTAQVRFWGDVAEFPVDVIASGADIVTRIQGCGLRRRLARSGVLQSPYRIAAGGLGSLVGYWSMETGTGATGFGSAVTANTKALTVRNTVNAASSSDFAATSLDLPELVGDQASVQGFVPGYALTAAGQEVRMLLECDTTTAGQGVDIVVAFTSGDYIVAEYIPVANTLQVVYKSADGTTIGNAGPTSMVGNSPWSTPSLISVESQQSGADIAFGLAWQNIGPAASFTPLSATAAATTLTAVKSVTVRNGGADVTTVVGHITVENTKTSIFTFRDVITGYAGETAATRALRLATAAGVTCSIGAAAPGITSELMGPQTEDTFLDLFDETAFVDGGISTESVGARSLTWWPRSAMYSKAPKLVVAVSKLDDIQTTDDDQTTENDVTATRVNGGVSNYMVTTGNLSTAAIGDYASTYDLNVFTDDQLTYQAQWRAAVGTVDEPRRSNVGFDALRLTSSDRTTLVSCREGDRFSLTGAAALLAPTAAGVIETQILGWTETITDTAWHFDINTRPGSPYEGASAVLILDDTSYGNLDSQRLAL